jgi:hypothetical protein
LSFEQQDTRVKADEYLEGVLKESFERELEVNENVARTLPFFTASFAVAAPLYGYVVTRIPPFAPSALSLVLHVLLVGGAACGAMILWNLFAMVRLREYRIPPKETEQIDWMEALKAYYRGRGLTDATVDKKVTDDLRARMIQEYAAAAEHNRQANTPKLRARTAGVTFLVIMLAIAFLMIGIIFATGRLEQSPKQDVADVVAKAQAARAAEAGRSAPVAAQVSDPAPGREVSGGAGGQLGAEGRPRMTNTDKPTSAPQPATTKPVERPAPPQSQILKRSEDGGRSR